MIDGKGFKEGSMETRPDFNEMKSYDDFKKYYWYRKELAVICKQIGIDYTGTKQELNHNIEEYFKGNLIKKRKTRLARTGTHEIGLGCSLIECGFSFNVKFREYFSRQTGVQNFKFTADMAAAWRKVKRNQDTSFTIQDMLDVYYGKSKYAKYDHSTCEWNNFLAAFCADKRNAHFKNKLKTASILWKIVKDSASPKVYSYDLVEEHGASLQDAD